MVAVWLPIPSAVGSPGITSAVPPLLAMTILATVATAGLLGVTITYSVPLAVPVTLAKIEERLGGPKLGPKAPNSTVSVFMVMVKPAPAFPPPPPPPLLDPPEPPPPPQPASAKDVNTAIEFAA